MCVCTVTPRSNSYVYVEGRGDGGNQNISRNISRNIPFRAGNQLLEIYIRGLEILILAKLETQGCSTCVVFETTVFLSGGVPGVDSGVTPEVQYSLSTVTGSNSTLIALVG